MTRERIIEATARLGPMTAKQVAGEIGVSESTARKIISRARAHGSKYLRVAVWAGDVPKYAPGPEPDAEGGSTGQRILAHLQDFGPSTEAQIVARTGMDKVAVESAMRRLKAKKGAVHIVDWKRCVGTGGRESAIVAAGPGNNAPRPDFSNAQAEYERRRVEKRRVKKIVNGERVRPRRQRATQAYAGPFDGLLR